MGPRLVGRGKVVAHIFVVLPPSTSMGPRLVGRGKPTRPIRPDVSPYFNGAASCGTRKAEGKIDTQRKKVTSMGPRLVGRGKDVWEVLSLLG